jgi:F-type H+-transporting ATPase subunit b
MRTQAQSEAEETRERAIKDIEAARAQALSEIYEQTADLATKVAEKILRRSINANDQRDLVNESLKELETAGAR